MPEDEEDEDWFEAAFEEEAAEGAEAEPSEEKEAEAAEEETPAEETPAEEIAKAADGEAAVEEEPEPETDEAEEAVAESPEETAEPTEEEPVTGGFDEAPPSGESGEPAEEDVFGDDFAAAFENAPGPGGPTGGGGAGGGGAGGAGGGEFGFDLGGGGGEGDETGGEFGFDLGAGGTPEAEEFTDEGFESTIPRIKLGIEGLDAMVQGGVPERSLIVAIGGAGTGKTTFGLQFLNQAIKNGERAVYITLEESHDRVMRSAQEKGWNFEEHEANQDLAIIDLDPVEMANSLTSIRNELPRLIEDFGASRLVLDSVSLLEMMYDDQATRRTEIYDFTKALKQAGVTTMLTSEASEGNPFASRHGIIEYLTDAVFVLRYVRPEDFRETRLAIEIQKIRDANHSRETKPYEITGEGISVYRQANIF